MHHVMSLGLSLCENRFLKCQPKVRMGCTDRNTATVALAGYIDVFVDASGET